MSSISPYDQALQFIKRSPGTGGSGSLAKLVLSLYNSMCGFSFAECVSNLDYDLTAVALKMVQDYAAHGETEDLRAAGKYLVDEYPGLWEMSLAMRDAREATRQRWQREELEREAATILKAEQTFMQERSRRAIPPAAAMEMISADDGWVDVYHYRARDWRATRLKLDQVRAAVHEHGTGFINWCPEAGYMLGVFLDGQLYYAHSDFDVRERYLESGQAGTASE